MSDEVKRYAVEQIFPGPEIDSDTCFIWVNEIAFVPDEKHRATLQLHLARCDCLTAELAAARERIARLADLLRQCRISLGTGGKDSGCCIIQGARGTATELSALLEGLAELAEHKEP